MAEQLIFEDVPGSWRCGNDYPKVFVTKISGVLGVVPFAHYSNVNVDYDGASNAYGPPGTAHLDNLSNAGPSAKKGWFGVASLSVKAVEDFKKAHPKATRIPKIDTKAKKDVFDRFPVIQQDGEPNPGLYVSASSKPRNTAFPEWDQRRWWDAATVPFGALSGKLSTIGGVQLNDFGFAMRVDQDRQSPFFFKDTGPDGWAVGECSLKVLRNLGGKGRDNNFANVFLTFPDTRIVGAESTEDMFHPRIKAQLAMLSTASNAEDLPMLMAFYAQAGKGASGLALFQAYQQMTKEQRQSAGPPVHYFHFATGLRNWGYKLNIRMIGDFPPPGVARMT